MHHIPRIRQSSVRDPEQTGFFAPPSDRAHFILIVAIVLCVCTAGAAWPVLKQIAMW